MKLLLINSEINQADWIRRRLEIENNQVMVIPDWQTGWTMTHQSQYDAVLLTMNIAESNEADLRWTDERRTVPLLLIVSPDTPDNKAWCLESGADDCVGNSVDIRELTARLYALCRRKSGHFATRSELSIDDLDINLSERSVYRAGKRISLLPREYYLLLFLMQNRERVISKKEILENVWKSANSIRPNTVEVYINYLRNKIDRQSTTKLIHTVVGMGYVIRL
ncbi:response regulator transcription factor [Spirosoma agri]|uniref:Response regulator transcription factor n=1 Tax=Spirosoma agri TaxID=1987381 RepID=A0A6M0IE76_9BACT|nr:response regulator transcription factor [Spirosoma agri]NEU66042.1 response regulator transcription factor [Spirosoma agri]